MRLTAPGFTRTGTIFLAGLIVSGSAAAFEIQLGEESTLKIDNLFTVGGVMRTQDRDFSLIGKPNLRRLLGQVPRCLRRMEDDLVSGPDTTLDADGYNSTNLYNGSTCTTSNGTTPDVPSPANIQFVNDPGSYNINGDDGDLNFDKGDIVHATAKITSDISLSAFGFNAFARALYLFDNNYDGLVELKPDTTLTPRHENFSQPGKDTLANDFQFLDYFISRSFTLGERNFSIKAGNQVLNWGESAFLIPNSLNSISPPNQALLRVPGFDIKELFQPVGMIFASGDLVSGVGLELFYQYEFKPLVADPAGSFFSQSDILGAGSGQYALLGFGKAPEDPLGLYQPNQNQNTGGMQDPCCVPPPGDPLSTLGSRASRTAYRDKALEQQYAPSNGGQYGAAVKYFADWLNGGTEFGLYYANYHSRFPTVSFISSDLTCIGRDTGSPATNVAALVSDCGLGPDPNQQYVGQTVADVEPLPVDTIKLFVEYPEDIHMYGFSFNTTIGDWAFAGEYAFRDNLPIQIHTVDLTLAAISPSLPRDTYNIGAAILPNSRGASAAFTPLYRNVRNRRDPGEAVDPTDFSQTGYGPNEYIRGYERMKQGQTDITFIKTIGGDNPLGATQIVVVMELGHTQVFDFPELGELQFQGAGTDTHISVGGDNTVGINPLDIRSNPNDPTSVNTDISKPGFRQNPTAHADIGGFGTAESYGYRLVALTKYDSAFLGINLELLTGFFHDVEGVGPGIGQNFVEGRKQILGGIRWDYLSKYTGELRYTWFTGGQLRDSLRDRDNLLLFLGYQF